MGKLIAVLFFAAGWAVVGDGYELYGSHEERREVARDGATVRTEQVTRRSTRVRLPQDHRGVDCRDGMDRCNLHPSYVVPGVQYHDVRPGLGMGH